MISEAQQLFLNAKNRILLLCSFLSFLEKKGYLFMIFIAANQHIVNQLNICHVGTKTETDEKKWPTSLNTYVDDLCSQLTVRASEQHDA